MYSILSTIATAAISFTATNIDDIFVLTFFFCQGVRPSRVVAGQYLGFTGLILVSLVGCFAHFVLPESWIGLLGLVPIIIGLKKLWDLRSDKSKHLSKNRGASVLTVATLTFSNGGDNIGIYAPLFAVTGVVRLIIILSIFFVLLGVWCLAGYFLGSHPMLKGGIQHYGHILVPFVLIGLGIYIILNSRTLSL